MRSLFRDKVLSLVSYIVEVKKEKSLHHFDLSVDAEKGCKCFE
jgi:hypothetical protein